MCRFFFTSIIVQFICITTADEVSTKRVEVHSGDVEPEIFGIRVIDIGKLKGFIAYSETGITIVHPDVKVRVNVYGYNLDKINLITLTTENCFTSAISVKVQDFVVHKKDRIDFNVAFAESEEPYQICYEERSYSQWGDEVKRDMIMIDDIKTWITTELLSENDHIFPMYVQVTILIILFCLSALMSGLNLGLIALTPQELQLIRQSGSTDEQRYAETILPVRKRGNYLLCTILLMNVVVNAAIAIFLEDISDGMLAFIISSTGIVVVGEIIPQSICIKKGLAVGAHTIWLTRAFMFITFPLSYPISLILDKLIGQNMPVYDRNKLIQLMKMAADQKDELHSDLKIAVGGMEIYRKTVGDILTKIEDAFMLSEDTVLDAANISEIVRQGYTRIPVYKKEDRNNIVSVLMVKDLALINPADKFTVKNVCDYNRYPLRFVDDNEPLHSLLEEFKEGNYHLAIVQKHRTDTGDDNEFSEHQQELLGIVTLEDIIEEILQAEIVDETDIITDNVYRSKRKNKKEPQFKKLFLNETLCKSLSLQMEAQVKRYLRDQHVLFADDYLNKKTFSFLVKKNAKQVDLTLTSRADGISREAFGVNLFTKGVASRRCIVIIEGKAVVTINNMTFEIGPWNCFGTEILQQIEQLLNADLFREHDAYLTGPKLALIRCIKFVPDFTLRVSKFCRFIQITPASYMKAYQISRINRETRNGHLIESHAALLHYTNNATRLRAFSDAKIFQTNQKLVEHREIELENEGSVTKKRCGSDFGREESFLSKITNL